MMVMTVERSEVGRVTTHCHNVEEAALLEPLLKLLIVTITTAVKSIVGGGEGGGLQTVEHLKDWFP